jgi:Predicted membrane protein
MASPETHIHLTKSETNATSSVGIQDPNFYANYGPLAHVTTASTRLPAFGGELQPGLYKPVEGRKFANPAPLGLSGFALTTFVLGCINMGARDITEPNIVASLAYAYGGLVQLCAGMW